MNLCKCSDGRKKAQAGDTNRQFSESSIYWGGVGGSGTGLGLAVSFWRLLRLIFQILDDDGDATIGCVERLTGRAWHLIGIAPYLRNLVCSQTAVLHQPPGGVGPIRGKLPIPVFAPAGVGLGIGVTFDGEVIRKLP